MEEYFNKIIENWEKDCQFDQTNLSKTSSETPVLHFKYYKIYLAEKLKLKNIENKLKQLKFEKREFYINPTKEDIDRGWKIPDRGKPLRAELNEFVDCDNDVLKLELKLGVQHEKVELLKVIIQQINNRTFIIKNIIEDRKWANGN